MATLSPPWVVHVFVVLLFAASSVALVGGEGGGGGSSSNANVDKTCHDVPFQETCVSTLSSFNGSKDANTSSMVGLMVRATMPTLADAYSTTEAQYNHVLPAEKYKCFTSCLNDIYIARDALDVAYGKSSGNIVGANLAGLHKFFQKAKEKHRVWNCDRCRRGEEKKKADAISLENEAEKRMDILAVLVERATKDDKDGTIQPAAGPA